MSSKSNRKVVPHRTFAEDGDVDQEMNAVGCAIGEAIEALPLPAGYCCVFLVLRSEDRNAGGGRMDAQYASGCVPDLVGGPATIGAILKDYGEAVLATVDDTIQVLPKAEH